MRRECRERFPRRRLQRKPLVSNPGMHHGTRVTHVPWCMSGSLSRGGGETVPGVPGACPLTIFCLQFGDQNCGLRMCRECRERFPRRRLQRKPLVSNPGMHHGTCVTHVPWCMSGSLSRGGGENVPGVPGACALTIFCLQFGDQKASTSSMLPKPDVVQKDSSDSLSRSDEGMDNAALVIWGPFC